MVCENRLATHKQRPMRKGQPSRDTDISRCSHPHTNRDWIEGANEEREGERRDREGERRDRG